MKIYRNFQGDMVIDGEGERLITNITDPNELIARIRVNEPVVVANFIFVSPQKNVELVKNYLLTQLIEKEKN